jgi:hypothetical protein
MQLADGLPGASGLAGEFDGLNDHVEVMDPTKLQIEGHITLEAWVQVEATDGFRNIIAKGYTFSPAGENFLRVRDGAYQVGSWAGSGLNRQASVPIPAEDVGTGKWTHLVGLYNGTRWELYRDGELVAASNNTSRGAVAVNEGWAIGARGDGTQRFFSGVIDEAAIYDKALSEERIAAHYQAATSPGVEVTGPSPLALLDAAGQVLARSVAVGDGSTHSIPGLVAPSTGTYFVHVSSTQLFPYSVVVTRDSALNLEPNDDLSTAQELSSTGGAFGEVGVNDPLGDFYAFVVQEDDALVITTLTPADGPFQPVNDLDPVIELFDPSGNLVALNDNGGADGRNARIEHTADDNGMYRVRVFGAAGTSGDYVLDVEGATGAGSLAPLRVTSSDPPAGAYVQVAPTHIDVDFSSLILRPEGIDPAVLSVGGLAATGVTAIDGDTLRFDLPALGEATHEVVIDAGALTDLGGQSNTAYQATLTIDGTGPRIVSSSIGEGSVLPAGNLSIVLAFDEQINALGLQSLGAVLFGLVSGQSYAADRVQVASDMISSTLTLEFDNLPDDSYTLQLPSGAGAVEDLAGNMLDGEAGMFPTGDGQPGGAFLLTFSLDAEASPLRPFDRLLPLGSLAFASTENFGVVNTIADTDDHTFFVEAGEVVMAIVTPTDPAAILTVELVGEAGGVIAAPAAGQPVVLPATTATTSGIKSLRIGGDMAGAKYTLEVYRNVVVERDDTSVAEPLSIDASAVDIGLQRLAVLGTSFAPGFETVFATTGSQWKYLDDRSNLMTAWRELEFDDAGWNEGPSVLGFGTLSNGNNSVPITTTINSGPQANRIVTTYFRRAFDVADPSLYESLSLQLLVDDGAAVYLNGERIALTANLPDGAAFDTLASEDAPDETAYLPFSVDPSKLRAGQNVLAVEVHQGGAGSSDLGMDAILIGSIFQDLQQAVDVDRYTLDLTGLAGRSIDVALAGQDAVDFSGAVLELLDVDGTTVLATATVDPFGVPADNYDMAILGFSVPADGVYTLQLTSSVPAGQYGIVVTVGALFESEPNSNPSDPRRTLESGAAAIGFLSEVEIDAFDVVLSAGQTLVVAARPILGASPENTLDPQLRLMDGNLAEVAADDNSLDGRGALLDFRADESGTYTILVHSVSGQGEYVLELLDAAADFGDAPASYATLHADDGPRHLLSSGLLLGTGATAEADGQPPPDSDSLDDGVTFGVLTPGELASVTVIASSAGKLDAWIDFSGDGDFDDLGEQIFSSAILSAGSNVLPVFNVPAGALVGTTAARFRLSSSGGLSPRGLAADGEVEDYTVTIESPVPSVQVVGRHVFYNNSRFDGSNSAINADDDLAIAPDKQALLGDAPAEFANYTTYIHGINGIMVDVEILPDAGNVDAGQFVFRMGNTNEPNTWPLAPSPSLVSVRQGAGLNNSDRIVVTWPDGAITNTWLQVSLLATIETGLAEPDVFLLGNAIGDAGLGNPADRVLVDEVDRAATRSNPRHFASPAPIDFPFDFNRDTLVDSIDRAIVRAYLTAGGDGLILLNHPGEGPSPAAGVQFAVAAHLPLLDDAPPPEEPRRRARRAAVRGVFKRLGSDPPVSPYRTAGHGRLRAEARRHERDARLDRRRLAAATDAAMEELTQRRVIESNRTDG